MEAFRASPQQAVAWLRSRQGRLGAVQVTFEAPAPPSAGLVTEIVDRFEILRTVVRGQGEDEPVQIIVPSARIDIARYDRPQTLSEALAAETAALGTPEIGPNFRVAAWRHDESTTTVLTGSPSCVDIGSLQLLAEVLRGSRTPDALSLLQYADVAEWLWQHAVAPSRIHVAENVDRPVATRVASTVFAEEQFADVVAAIRREGWAAADVCNAAGVLLAWRHGVDTIYSVAPGRAHADLVAAIGPFSFLAPVELAPLDGESFASLTRRTSAAFSSLTAAEAPARMAIAAPFAIAVGLPAGPAQVVARDNHGAELLVSATDTGVAAVQLSALTTPIAVSGADIARVAAAGSRGLREPVDCLPTLGAQQIAGLLEVSQGNGYLPAPASVVEAICHRAQAKPDAVAIVQSENELTYAELWSRSALARDGLQLRGVGHGTLVAVRMPRSVDAVVTMLGVLRCGGAVVPLDTRSPAARRDHIVDAAAAQFVVGDGTESQEIPVGDLGTAVATGADVPINPGDLCYAIATSGTTGRPRVVAIPHRALANRIAWGQCEYPLAPEDRVLHCASIAFDFAMWEIFAPLAAGACIVIAPEKHEDDFVAVITDALVDGAATVAHFTPSMLRELISDPRGAAAVARLRHVFSGGEALSEELATRLRGLTDAVIWNQYGPAEATVDATFHRTTGRETGPTTPIGRPIGGLSAYVVDRWGHLAPDGVSGELHLAGVGLAHGYLGEAALTATRFVPDWLGNSGGRLYRTGDLVRRNADGSLVFVGRTDDQAKIRGIRVEPDEIATVLRTHTGVHDAAVIAHEIGEADVGLTAYVVGHISSDEVKAHLSERLPSYMTPSQVVLIDALPRTVNGKLDRVALAAIKPRRSGNGFAAPKSAIEKALAAIWASVLRAEQVGMTDEFFEIGGHSLNATRVVGRMREALLLDVSVRDVFQHPTIGSLVDMLAARDGYDPETAEAVAALWLRNQKCLPA